MSIIERLFSNKTHNVKNRIIIFIKNQFYYFYFLQNSFLTKQHSDKTQFWLWEKKKDGSFESNY